MTYNDVLEEIISFTVYYGMIYLTSFSLRHNQQLWYKESTLVSGLVLSLSGKLHNNFHFHMHIWHRMPIIVKNFWLAMNNG